MQGAARFDDSGRYRTWLERSWAAGPTVAFVMLNPNTADATSDDPTIRRCVGFAQRWAFGRLIVVNLFTWRCRHPADLSSVADPVGPRADAAIAEAIAGSERVVVAWGNHGALLGRDQAVAPLIGGAWSLGLTKRSQPRHPLYVRRDQGLVAYPRGEQ
jgi:hypothetical protein